MKQIPSPRPFLLELPDPRKSSRVRYSWESLWKIALMAMSAGLENILAVAEWLEVQAEEICRSSGLAQLPAQATLYRFFAGLDAVALEAAFSRWVVAWGIDLPRLHLSFDGKYLKGSARKRSAQEALLLCSAYVQQLGTVLFQQQAQGNNELAAAHELLPHLSALERPWVFVGDALYCGIELVQAITQQGGDYLLAVKNNQRHYRTLIEATFQQAKGRCESYIQQQWRSGELWRWQLACTPAPAALVQAFSQARTLLKLERQVQCPHAPALRHEVHYALTSLVLPAQEYLELWRGHWGIENRLHHKRDTVFKEDACRSRQAAQPLAVLRNVVLGILHQLGCKALQAVRRFRLKPHLIPDFLGFNSGVCAFCTAS